MYFFFLISLFSVLQTTAQQDNLNDIEALRKNAAQLVAWCEQGELNNVGSFYSKFQKLGYQSKRTLMAEVDVDKLEKSYAAAIRAKLLNHVKHGWKATGWIVFGIAMATTLNCVMDTDQCDDAFTSGFDAAGIVVIFNTAKNLGLSIYDSCHHKRSMIADFKKAQAPTTIEKIV